MFGVFFGHGKFLLIQITHKTINSESQHRNIDLSEPLIFSSPSNPNNSDGLNDDILETIVSEILWLKQLTI